MRTPDHYIGLPAVRALHRAGEWDAALAELEPSGQHAELRAEILIDRYFWQGGDPDPARRAVAALDSASIAFRYLAARVAYVRVLFSQDPEPDDGQLIEAGYRAAAEHPSFAGWGEFHLGVFSDNLRRDPVAAKKHYARAAELCAGDLLLESYVLRHQAGHLAHAGDREMAVLLLRRSLYLRSALGYRPQVAAAQATLADELSDGPERDALLSAASATAGELGLTWLKRALKQGK
ncbi:hypothetical protein [Micromonospora sp. NPDC005806]|uniref:hypothetical protein n=1 Tax=Micromonospora sp. NPDC005806 TaxID=3364234 RepID=UPI003680829E